MAYKSRFFLFSTFILASCAQVGAQSINIDFKAHGEGPSSGFAGAANQPGFWNSVQFRGGLDRSNFPRSVYLWDIDGHVVDVRYQSNGGSLSGVGPTLYPSTTGDYSKLLLDGYAGSTTYQPMVFTNFQPGTYTVYTYAVSPGYQGNAKLVSVDGSTSPNPQTVTGPIRANLLLEGQHYAVHEVTTTGTITIHVRRMDNPDRFGFCNGIQFVKH